MTRVAWLLAAALLCGGALAEPPVEVQRKAAPAKANVRLAIGHPD